MKRPIVGFLVLLFFMTFLGFSPAQASGNQDKMVASVDTVLKSRTGTASYYAAKFQGKRTSCGEKLDNQAYTCASSGLAYGTWVRVTHLKNGKSVVVRVTDRFGPRAKHLVDLTVRAAKDIDLIRYGVARVRMEVLNPEVVEVLIPKDTITVALTMPTTRLEVPVKIPSELLKKEIRM